MKERAFHYRPGQAEIDACRKDVERAPGNPFVHQKLGQLLSMMGRYEEATAEFEQALTTYRESSLDIGWLEVEIREELGLARYAWGITSDNRGLVVEGYQELEKARRRASELGLVAGLPSELRVQQDRLVEVRSEPIQVARIIEWHLMDIDSCGSDWAWKRFDLDKTVAQEVRRVQRLYESGDDQTADQILGTLYEARFRSGTRKFSLVLCNRSELKLGLDKRRRRREDTSNIRGDQYEGEAYICFRKWVGRANPLIHKEELSSLLEDRIEKTIKQAYEEEGFSVSVRRLEQEHDWGRSEDKEAKYALSGADRTRERKKWTRERALVAFASSMASPPTPEDECESCQDTLCELTANTKLTESQRRLLTKCLQCLNLNPRAKDKEIALAVGLSPPDLCQRLKRIANKLRKSGNL